MRDGVSLTERREMRPLALPSEIMRLENLHGYLKFPGPWPVASIRLDYVERPRAAESFIPREGVALPQDEIAEPPENETSESPALQAGYDGAASARKAPGPEPREESGSIIYEDAATDARGEETPVSESIPGDAETPPSSEIENPGEDPAVSVSRRNKATGADEPARADWF